MWKASPVHPVADDLGVGNRAAGENGALALFEDQDPGALADHEAVAVAVEGAEALPGSSFRVESARSEANPPMHIGVIVASAPPATIASA